MCIWKVEQTIGDPLSLTASLTIEANIERPYPIANILARQGLLSHQIVIISQGGSTIEIVNLDLMQIVDRLESKSSSDTYIIIENLLQDGPKDFMIMNTQIPGDYSVTLDSQNQPNLS